MRRTRLKTPAVDPGDLCRPPSVASPSPSDGSRPIVRGRLRGPGQSGFGTALALDGERVLWWDGPATSSGFPMPSARGGHPTSSPPRRGLDGGGRWVAPGVSRGRGCPSVRRWTGRGTWPWRWGHPPPTARQEARATSSRRGHRGGPRPPDWQPARDWGRVPASARPLALQGDVLVASAPGGGAPGEVRVFRRSGESWSEEARPHRCRAQHRRRLTSGHLASALEQRAPGGGGAAAVTPGASGFQPARGTVFLLAMRGVRGGSRGTSAQPVKDPWAFPGIAAWPHRGRNWRWGAAPHRGGAGRGGGSSAGRAPAGQAAGGVHRRGPRLPLRDGPWGRAGQDLVVGAPMAGEDAGSVNRLPVRRALDLTREQNPSAAGRPGAGGPVRGGGAGDPGRAWWWVGPGADFFEGLATSNGLKGAPGPSSRKVPTRFGLNRPHPRRGRSRCRRRAPPPSSACNQVDILSFHTGEGGGGGTVGSCSTTVGRTHEGTGSGVRPGGAAGTPRSPSR